MSAATVQAFALALWPLWLALAVVGGGTVALWLEGRWIDWRARRRVRVRLCTRVPGGIVIESNRPLTRSEVDEILARWSRGGRA